MAAIHGSVIRRNNEAVGCFRRNPSKSLMKLRRAMVQLKGSTRRIVVVPAKENVAEQEMHDKKEINITRSIEQTKDEYKELKKIQVEPQKYDEGMNVLFQPLELSPNDLDDEAYLEAAITFNQALCFSLLGRYSDADDYFIDTHCILSSRNFNQYHDDKKLDNVLVHINEGHNHYRAKKYEEANDAYCEAVNLIRKCGDEQEEEIYLGSALNCIGVVRFISSIGGDPDRKQLILRAIKPLNAALSLLLSTGIDSEKPEKQLLMATIVNNIGRVRYCVEDHEGALPFFEKAYFVRRSHYGDCHLDVCMSALNVGFCHHKLGETSEAMIYYRRYVDIMLTDALHGYLDDFIGLVTLIAEMWFKDKDYSAAIIFFKIALKCAIRHYGRIHDKVSDILSKFGNVLYEFGDTTLALEIYQQGLETERALVAADHINLAVTLSNIAVIHDDEGRPLLALKNYIEALGIFQSNEGCEIHAANTMSAIGLIKSQSDNTLQDASDLFQEALRLREAVLGEYHVDTSSTLNFLGIVYAKQNRFQQALLCLERCLKIRRFLKMPHNVIAILLYDICDILIEKFDNTEKALRYYEESLKLEGSCDSCELAELLETIERIGKIHEVRNEPYQAIAFYNKAASLCEGNDAHDVFDDARQRKNLSRYLLQLGNSCLEVGEVKKAVKYFARAMKYDAEGCREQFRVPFSQELYKCNERTFRGAAAA